MTAGSSMAAMTFSLLPQRGQCSMSISKSRLWGMSSFLALRNIVAWRQLTSANYVEHYALLPARLPDERSETPQPRHSRNTSRVVTNLAIFHLQRHSDRHAFPAHRYQSLRHFENLPQLSADISARCR